MAANVSASVRNCVSILGMHVALNGKGQTVKIENGTSNRGAVLLGELKALVDSFPPCQRRDVIKMLEIAFRGLNADRQGRHFVDMPPASPSPKTSVGTDSSDELQNEDQE